MSLQRVLAAVDAAWEREVEFLRGLVTRPSVVGAEGEVQRFVAGELARMGLDVDVWEIDHAELKRHAAYGPVAWSYAGRPNVAARIHAREPPGRPVARPPGPRRRRAGHARAP